MVGEPHGEDRIVYGGVIMVGEPVREDDVDDTVLRPRRSVHAARHDDHATGDDALGDTVIRPSAGGRPPTASATDDTVVRPRRHPDPAVAPGRTPPAGPPAVPDRSDGGPTGLQAGAPAVPRVPSIRVAGRVVRLDRPVVVGRRPAAPRVVRGPAPELLTVPSPSGQVSSSHLLVHAAGEAAVVDDLRSTNGTVVRPPGSAPFRMASGASNVVLTGTLVEIGDGNVIEVLSPHLRVGSDDGLPPFPSVP